MRDQLSLSFSKLYYIGHRPSFIFDYKRNTSHIQSSFGVYQNWDARSQFVKEDE